MNKCKYFEVEFDLAKNLIPEHEKNGVKGHKSCEMLHINRTARTTRNVFLQWHSIDLSRAKLCACFGLHSQGFIVEKNELILWNLPSEK